MSQPIRRRGATAATASDRAAVVKVVADYYESWFSGDHERMRASLHPNLAKRSVEQGAGGDPFLDTIGAEDMVEATARGAGKKYPTGYEVVVCDVDQNLATVTVMSTPYVEYLHLARLGERWLIVNVLWRRRPNSAPHR